MDTGRSQSFGSLIGGEWRRSADTFADIKPSDTREIAGYFSTGTAGDIGCAVAAARQGFPAWAGSTSQQRAEMLDAAANEILTRREELGRLLAREFYTRTRTAYVAH